MSVAEIPKTELYMSQELPLVSLITINFNALEVTLEMLASVAQLNYPNLEVIVVDNASDVNPGSILQSKYPDLIYVRSEQNLGFSGGNNLGIKASRGTYLFFVNNDTELIDGALELLVQLFQQNNQLGAVSPLIYHHPDFHSAPGELIQFAGTTAVNAFTARNKTLGAGQIDQGQFEKPVPIPYTHGAAMMVPRTVIQEVGMMPEVFFLYYEELDWSEKIKAAGYEIFLEPRAKIYHKESVTVGKSSILKTYYLNRNRVLFTRRNRSGIEVFLFTLFLILITIPKNLLQFLIKGEWQHIKAFFQAMSWHLKAESRSAIKPLPRLIDRIPSIPTK